MEKFQRISEDSSLQFYILLAIISIELCLFLFYLSTDLKLIVLGLFLGWFIFIAVMKNPLIGISLVILITYTGAYRLILPTLFFSSTIITIFAFLLMNLINGKLHIVKTSQNILIVTFLLIICLSMIVSIFPKESISPFFEFIKNLIFFFIFINVVQKKKDLEFLTWILIISGVLACIIGIYIIFSTGLGELFLIYKRFGSVLGNANWFAGTIVPLIPISYFFSKIQSKIILKIFLFSAIAIYIVSIAFSLSRSALLAMVIILLIIFIHEVKNKKALIITPIFLLLMIVIFFPQISNRIVERFNLVFSGKDVSVNIRLWVLKAGINMFLDHPVLGVGIGNFVHLSGQYVTLTANKVAHNMYLDVAAETGIFGLILFISIFGKSLLDVRKQIFNHNKNFAFLAEGYYWGLIGYLITGFFVSVHFYFFLWLILSFTVSVSIVGGNNTFIDK